MMKKALIALSVAAGMVGVAQAENTTTLYGSVGYDLRVHDTDYSYKVNGVTVDEDKATADLHRTKTVFGIKGTEDLNNGLQAFYKLEFESGNGPHDGDGDNGVFKTKKAYVGLKGAFGKVTLGNQSSVFEDATDTANPFITADDWYSFGTALGDDGNGDTKKAISYVYESGNGFNAGVLVDIDAVDGASRFIDSFELAAWYEMNGFNAGLAYAHNEDNNPEGSGNNADKDAIALAVGYATDQFEVDFNAEHFEVDGGRDENRYNLSGQYFYGPHTFRAGLGLVDPDNADSRWSGGLGYQYNFSKRTYTWIEGSYSENRYNPMDAGPNYNGPRYDGYVISVGMRHDF